MGRHGGTGGQPHPYKLAVENRFRGAGMGRETVIQTGLEQLRLGLAGRLGAVGTA